MTKTTRLNDLQLILLSTASQRDSGSLLPAPDSVAGDTDRLAKAIPPLLKRQLVEEAPIADASHAWRQPDQQPIGLYITDAGRALIAADEPGEGGNEPEDVGTPSEEGSPGAGSSDAETPGAESTDADTIDPEKPGTPAPRAGSKTELVITLLRRPEGATLAEMVAATGWLPHSTRAVLTGLRKKRHAITRDKRDDETCYRIAEAN